MLELNSKMRLANVTSAPIDKPVRAVVYGTEGVGKSTLLARAPRPIVIGAEDGTSQLEVARFPEPESWEDILEAVRVLTDEPHEFQSVGFDTLDWMEPLCWRRVAQDGGK